MLVSLASTGSGVLFQGGVLFSIENAIFLIFFGLFWPIWAILSPIYAPFWWTFYRPK